MVKYPFFYFLKIKSTMKTPPPPQIKLVCPCTVVAGGPNPSQGHQGEGYNPTVRNVAVF